MLRNAPWKKHNKIKYLEHPEHSEHFPINSTENCSREIWGKQLRMLRMLQTIEIARVFSSPFSEQFSMLRI